MLWGLAHSGEKGAKAVLDMMKRDIDQTLALAGCKSISEITRDMVVHETLASRL